MVAALRAVVDDPLPGAGCDVEEARRFLGRLDPAATVFTFATFTDAREKPSPDPLARIQTGTFEELAPWLERQNMRGAGVFVTVNETDGNGRKKDNIVGIRALWQEADRGDEPKLPVEPHMVVESSPGKFHRYVLVRDGVLDEFELVQLRLVDDYGSDPNAKDRSRVLRLPGFYHMKNPDSPHLVRLIEVSEAPPLLWDDAKAHFPPAEGKPKAGLGSGFNRAASGEAQSDAGTPLVNPAEVASALEHLNPDMAYMDWLKVGMALHSADPGPGGLALWDTWSAPGTLYRPGEPEYRWGTFDADREGGVTLGTLFRMAGQAGWDRSYGDSEWVQELVPDERERKLAEFNRHHGMVMVEGKDVVVYRELDENVGRFVTRHSSVAAMSNYCRDQTLPDLQHHRNGDVVVRRKPLFEIWMQWGRRRNYSQLVFRPVPGLVAGELSLPDENVLNLYQGLAIQPKEGDCSKMIEHIREIWCGGNAGLHAYVMGWLARLFQIPDERGHTVLLLQSGQGTGKNIIIDELVRAFGDHAAVCVKPDDLVGKFNAHLATSVLVFANEAIWGGDKTQEGSLKSLITDEELFVEKKLIPKYRVRNRTHLIMASNNDWAAPIDFDDRRFVVLEVSEARKGDLDYFGRLKKEIDDGGTEALVWHLLQHDISGFDPRKLPNTGPQGAKLEAKVRSLDSVARWWLDCLQDGFLSVRSISTSAPMTESRGWVDGSIAPSLEGVYRSYREATREAQQRVLPKSVFGRHLAKLLGDKLKSAKRTVPRSWHEEMAAARAAPLIAEPSSNPVEPKKERERYYSIPALAECRALMERHLGQAIVWDEADTSDGGDPP